MTKTKENNTLLFVALGAAALLLVAAIVGMKFFAPRPPPPPPPAPAAPQVLPTQTPMMYRANLDDDARRYGVPLTSPEALAKPLTHTVELDAPRTLKPGETIETEHLRITASIVKEWAKTENGSGFRFDHLVLSVANRSDDALAYRVDTRVTQPEKCSSMASIAHNAVALQPGEVARRTECLFHPGMVLTVGPVETVTLPAIGYYYVSRLTPQLIGLDARTGTGHTPPKDVPFCKYVPARDIESSGAAWADVIDFYARHNCDEYRFFRTYRFRRAAGPLPAGPDENTPPPAAPAQPN